jgi:Flp pilus assembly protein TadG
MHFRSGAATLFGRSRACKQSAKWFLRGGLRSSARLFLSHAHGAVGVEFALIGLPLFAVILELLQVSSVFLAEQEFETAAEEASRLVLTGQAQKQGLSQSAFKTAVCANLPAMFSCSGVMIDMQTAATLSSISQNGMTSAPTLTFNPQGNVTNAWTFQTGTQGSIVVLRIMYLWPVLPGPLSFGLANQPNNKRLMMATSVFKNELY